LARPDATVVEHQLQRLQAFKAARNQRQVQTALDRLAATANTKDQNVFASVVEAAIAGATHGEIVACLRRELGFGQPLVIA
jgi:methylmalonyl-CoA mutase N-terminal domain/subunit